jgi:cell division septum initiation protein DivIVA
MGPELFLATDDQVNELLDNISQKLDQLKKDAELLNQTVLTAEGE